MSKKTVRVSTSVGSGIAIIGIGCRFPGAHGPSEFWELLKNGKCTITEIPPHRAELLFGKTDYKFGGFIDGFDLFDAGFFNNSPREAELMDPQQRLSLETAAEALFDSGYTRQRLREIRTGVYVGCHHNEYFHNHNGAQDDVLLNIGGSRGGIAGRISFAWDLNGPSLSIDSDRSSSLTALHLACEAMRTGEIDLAVSGGVNLILAPEITNGFNHASMLSPDGIIRFADIQANGFVRSEGVGFLILKRLEEAISDNDNIYAIIRSSSVLHNGASSLDIMTPSCKGQEGLIREALKKAHVSPADIDYVETHGTGTPLGDQTELLAVGSVLKEGRSKDSSVIVGSVKTNIGHCEAAAGIAGVIKVALAMRKRVLPPSLHFKEPNPETDLGKLHIEVNTGCCPWPRKYRPSNAGVSSFGLTGSNAHVILQSVGDMSNLQPPQKFETGSPEILVFSSHSEQGLRNLAQRFLDFLKSGDMESSLKDYAFTASNRRNHDSWRLSVVGNDSASLSANLTAYLNGEEVREISVSTKKVPSKPKIVFVYPGQGGQWLGMGKQLFASEPVFKESFEECDKIVRKQEGWSLVEQLHADAGASRMEELEVVQPLLTAMYIAISELWKSWGVNPDSVVGTSMGEIAAAYIAGNISLHDAMKIVCTRANLMKALSGKGAMAVVELSVKETEKLLVGHESLVSVAVSNSKTSTVISGDPGVIEQILKGLEKKEIYCKLVKVDVASHSPQMDEIAKELEAALSGITPRNGTIPMYSTVVSTLLTGDKMNGRYWVKNLRNPVYFSDTFQTLLKDDYSIFIECSPHPVLWSPMFDGVRQANRDAVVLPTSKRDKDERAEILSTLGSLHVNGVQIDWESIYPDGKTVSLPLPHWEHKKYWYQKTDVHQKVLPVEQGLGNPQLVREPQEFQSRSTILLMKLNEALSQRERVNILVDFIQNQIAKVLGLPNSEKPAIDVPFREMGLKSVMAVEFRNMLSNAIKQQLPSSLLFNCPNIKALAEHVCRLAVPEKPNLGNILIQSGAVSQLQISEAVFEQQSSRIRERIGSILLKKGYISTEQLAHAIAVQAREPIAVIGMSCRFPGGADDPEAYWRLLVNGIDGISEVPRSRWESAKYFDPDPARAGKMTTRWGGFIQNVDLFDAGYFGISRREAEKMDPQQRLLLEVTMETLERAGQPLDLLEGSRTGVFIGAMNANDYMLLKRVTDNVESIEGIDSTGNANSIAAGRISYFLGLQGPAVTIDTACSSSLVAAHLACQSLHSGESRMTIVGGVNLVLTPETTIGYSKNRMMSNTGRCRTFDAGADGYVRGEGCGVLVFKRLSDAQLDGDPILGVIVSSATNQDGRTSGLTSPNGEAQKNLYLEALGHVGYEPSKISYIEAHGTGTPLGDPIEVSSISEVYKGNRDADHPLYIGSVKTNIGHLEAAAGVAGLMKVILALQNKKIPPHLHFSKWNKEIQVEGTNITVPIDGVPWQTESGPRVAAISSFGFSGTNAHLIIEEAPPKISLPSPKGEWPFKLVCVSAKSPKALEALAEKYSTYIINETNVTLADFAHTAMAARAPMSCRIAFLEKALHSLRKKLSDFAGGHLSDGYSGRVSAAKLPKTAFVYPNFGFEYSRMAAKLYSHHPVFRSSIDECDETIRRIMGFSVIEKLYGEADELDATRPLVQSYGICFAVQHSLALLWNSWGVQSDASIGEGLGEITAACMAGAVDVESALRILAQLATDREATGQKPDKFKNLLSTIKLSQSNQKIISSVTGEALEVQDILSSSYWQKQSEKRTPLNKDKLAAMAIDGMSVFLFIGSLDPNSSQAPNDVTLLQAVNSKEDDLELTLKNLALMYVQGAGVNWQEVAKTTGGRKIVIPTYAFQRERYWVETPRIVTEAHRKFLHPLISDHVETESGEHIFQLEVSDKYPRFLNDHRVHDVIVTPAVFYLEMTLAAATMVFKKENNVLKDIVVPEAMVIEDNADGRVVQLNIKRSGPNEAGFRIMSRPLDSVKDSTTGPTWKTHISGKISLGQSPLSLVVSRENQHLQSLKTAHEANQSGVEFYRTISDRGIPLGPNFQTIKNFYKKGNKIAVLVELPKQLIDEAGEYGLHPCMVDTGLHVIANQGQDNTPYIPVSIDSFSIYASPRENYWCEVDIQDKLTNKELVAGDFRFVEESGRILCEGKGFRFKRTTKDAVLRAIGKAGPGSYFQPRWKEVKKAVSAVPGTGGSFLIVSDTGGVADRIDRYLKSLGHQSQMIDDIDQLNATLVKFSEGPGNFKRIIYCGALDSKLGNASALEIIDQETRILKSLFEIAKNFLKPKNVKLWAVTRLSQQIQNEKVSTMTASSIPGLFKTLSLELPHLIGGTVDLPMELDDAVIDVLANEFCLDQEGCQLAIRSGVLYESSLVEVKSKDIPKRRGEVSPEGAYLITGGAGGLGLVTADVLASKGAKTIFLLGRSTPSADAEKLFLTLKSKGTNVEFVKCDVGSYEDVKNVFENLQKRFAIKGIIHGAGITSDGVFSGQSWNDFYSAFSAKVAGGIYLDAFSRSLNLDFFICYSSAASIFGLTGQSNYAAANSFLDSLMACRHGRGQAGISVNWGPWAQTGMWSRAAPEQRDKNGWSALGMKGLSNHEGASALGDLLFSDTSQVGVFNVDWSAFSKNVGSIPMRKFVSGLVPDSNKVAPEVAKKSGQTPEVFKPIPGELPFLNKPLSQRREAVETIIQGELKGILKADANHVYPTDLTFLEFGLDSVMAIELRNRLGEKFKTVFSATVIFTYPTIETLSEFIMGELKLNVAVAESQSAPAVQETVPPSLGNQDRGNTNGSGDLDSLLRSVGELTESGAHARLLEQKQRKAV